MSTEIRKTVSGEGVKGSGSRCMVEGIEVKNEVLRKNTVTCIEDERGSVGEVVAKGVR